jgi:twitching motility protein PilT
MLDFSAIIRYVIDQGASDLHLKVGAPPRVRVDGALQSTPFPTMSTSDVDQLLGVMLAPNRAEEYAASGDADFAFSDPELGRFRGNAFRQSGAAGIVLRRVVDHVPTIESLGLPPVISELASEKRGMVLVTGPTGSGKTTTLASMIDHINSTRAVNIVTIEDPIEVKHTDKLAIVNQREIGTDVTDYAQAMRRVLRQDPDVILVGEMRDAETVWAALAAAETGHLLLSTLHTPDAPQTVNRIVDFFPAYQQAQIRLTLAACLKGIVSQRLVERAGVEGRVPAIEVLVMTGRIADRIIDPAGGNGESIESMIVDGHWYGMQTFDQSLLSLVGDKRISVSDAMGAASRPHDLKLALEKAGLMATGAAA